MYSNGRENSISWCLLQTSHHRHGHCHWHTELSNNYRRFNNMKMFGCDSAAKYLIFSSLLHNIILLNVIMNSAKKISSLNFTWAKISRSHIRFSTIDATVLCLYVMLLMSYGLFFLFSIHVSTDFGAKCFLFSTEKLFRGREQPKISEEEIMNKLRTSWKWQKTKTKLVGNRLHEATTTTTAKSMLKRKTKSTKEKS